MSCWYNSTKVEEGTECRELLLPERVGDKEKALPNCNALWSRVGNPAMTSFS